MLILPRQARDKPRENSKRRVSAGVSGAAQDKEGRSFHTRCVASPALPALSACPACPACAAALLCLLQNVHVWCSEHPFGTNRNVANGHLTSLKDFQNGLIQIRTEKCPNEAIWKQICHSFGMVYPSSKLGADVLLIKWRPILAATW